MLFNQVETHHLHFLQNPLRNIDYLDKYCTKPSLYTRLLYRFPITRTLLGENQIKSLIGDALKKNLLEIKHSYKSELKPTPELIGEKHLELHLNTLTQYFNIEISPSFLSRTTESDHEQIKLYLKSTLFTKLEYTCNRISENFDLDDSYLHSTLAHQQLWTTYFLSEIFFLLSLGLMQAQYRKDEILIRPTRKLMPSLRNRWLAETSEAHSNMTDRVFLQEFGKSLAQGKPLSIEAKEMLTDYILDKCLSIHVRYLSPKLKENSRYQYLRDIVFVALFLEMRSIHGNRKTHYAAFSRYITAGSLSCMTSALTCDSLPKVDTAQSFISVQGSEYIRGALNFKYGLKKLVGILLGNTKDPKNKHDVKSLIGNNFEQEHMIDYIKNIAEKRFKVHPGFKAEKNAKVPDYDIDLVLEDTTYDTFYFIQAKYRLSSQPTFLSEQYEVMQKSDFKKGYAIQLLTLKNNLNEPSIRKKLNDHGLSSATSNNTHFILLHNLPFLNFHSTQGVAFYEWNLFRNLLKNGKISIGHDLIITEEHTLTDEQLNEPDRIVDAYFGETLSGRQNRAGYALYRNTKAVCQLGEMKIRCDVL